MTAVPYVAWLRGAVGPWWRLVSGYFVCGGRGCELRLRRQTPHLDTCDYWVRFRIRGKSSVRIRFREFSITDNHLRVIRSGDCVRSELLSRLTYHQ